MRTGIQGGIFIKALAGIFIALCVSMICGCNPDAFVSHISPSARSFEISDDGDSITIKFRTSEWNLHSVEKDGKATYPGLSSESAQTDKDGKLIIQIGDYRLKVKKSGKKELSVFLPPNFTEKENHIKLFITNNYEYDSVAVRQAACVGYVLDGIDWDANAKRLNEDSGLKVGWGPMSIINPGPDTLFFDKAVFGGATRKIEFTGDSDFGLYCDDFYVPIPDGILSENDSPVFNGEEITYNLSTIFEYPYKNDKMVRMTFPPTETEHRYYKMLWEYESYEIGYTMRVKNKSTGRIHTIKGTMTSDCPTGKYYLVYEKR